MDEKLHSKNHMYAFSCWWLLDALMHLLSKQNDWLNQYKWLFSIFSIFYANNGERLGGQQRY